MAMATYHYCRDNQNYGQKKAQVVVIMVPFPAQGHLNQLLHFSHIISSYNIPVHYVGTTTHIRQAKSRLQGWDPLSIQNIHFNEFPTPSFTTPSPNPKSSTKFPSHLQPSFNASVHLREPVGQLLHSIQPTAQRIVVIHDSLMTSVVQDVVKIPNAEAYALKSTSAFTIFSYLWESMGRPFTVEDETLKDLPTNDGCFTSEFQVFSLAQRDHKFDCGIIHDVCKVFEKNYFDLLTKEEFSGNIKNWALGPFNPVSISENKGSNQRHECLKWLDQQTPSSVIYVSFGTTSSLSDEQIEELAMGLEESGQKFIWVLRDADKGDVFGTGGVRRIELPKGYEDRVEGKQGMIVRDWAPQLEILAHPSTGGFMSHCGWNSCMESITMGVPIAAWPIHSDQPRNAMLITRVLKIGVIVKDWARRDELVTALTVKKAVTKLMASKEGEEMRKLAVEMGGSVRRSVAEGGVTRAELDSFITHITRI